MDMEHLSKSQIVLLTLLVSFVTSIATGIVTVALMGQAPPVVAQTVNRIVQQTVQQVVPASQHAGAGKTVVTEQKTVVVKESEMISQAINRISPSLVRLYSGPDDAPIFLGMGVVLDTDGTIVSDSAALSGAAEANIVLPSGSSTRAFVRTRDSQSGLVYLVVATSTLVKTPQFTPAVLAGGHAVLGQSVVSLYGKSISRIASGLVVAIVPGDAQARAPQVIETDIASDSIAPGSPIINTDGAVVGISTGVSRASSLSGFMSAAALLSSSPPSTLGNN